MGTQREKMRKGKGINGVTQRDKMGGRKGTELWGRQNGDARGQNGGLTQVTRWLPHRDDKLEATQKNNVLGTQGQSVGSHR